MLNKTDFLFGLTVKNKSNKEKAVFMRLNGKGKKFITKICAANIRKMEKKSKSALQSSFIYWSGLIRD
jgi:hypothetical protein